MSSFRTRIVARVIAPTVIAAAALFAAASGASAQTLATTHGFARCPQTPSQYTEVMKQLVSSASRARALADQNPLLEPDAAFYEAELAATRACVPAVASLDRAR